MVRFSNQLVAEAIQPMWAALQARRVSSPTPPWWPARIARRARAWVHEAGGVRPRRGRDLKGRCLSFAEREEIALARARGESMRAIARAPGPGAVDGLARAAAATPIAATVATGRRRRTRWPTSAPVAPSRPSFATNLALREVVQDDLTRRFSPEQIPGQRLGGRSSPISRRCGCRTRPSTSRSTSKWTR